MLNMQMFSPDKKAVFLACATLILLNVVGQFVLQDTIIYTWVVNICGTDMSICSISWNPLTLLFVIPSMIVFFKARDYFFLKSNDFKTWRSYGR